MVAAQLTRDSSNAACARAMRRGAALPLGRVTCLLLLALAPAPAAASWAAGGGGRRLRGLLCPAMESQFSCAHLATSGVDAAAMAALSYRPDGAPPDGNATAPWELQPRALLRAFARRRVRQLVFMGDSLSRQAWMSFVCSLVAGLGGHEWTAGWSWAPDGVDFSGMFIVNNNVTCVEGGKCEVQYGQHSRLGAVCSQKPGESKAWSIHCPYYADFHLHLDRAGAAKDEAGNVAQGAQAMARAQPRGSGFGRAHGVASRAPGVVRVWYVPTFVYGTFGTFGATLPGLVNALALAPTDVLVANQGVWYNWPSAGPGGQHEQDMARVVEDVRALHTEKRLPRLVWRETAPQWFAAPGGIFPINDETWLKATPKAEYCRQLDVAAAREADFRNRAAEAALAPLVAAGLVEMQRIWEATAALVTPAAPRGPTPVDFGDCTHYCLPGVPDALWTPGLQVALVRLLGLKWARQSGVAGGRAEEEWTLLPSADIAD